MMLRISHFCHFRLGQESRQGRGLLTQFYSVIFGLTLLDSRFRGNDERICGNDGKGRGNDGQGLENYGEERGNDRGVNLCFPIKIRSKLGENDRAPVSKFCGKDFKVVALMIVSLFGLALGGEVYEKTKEGNQLWHQGKYQDAFAKYTEALAQAKGPAEAQLHYNLGTSLYKQQKYEEAVKEFEGALVSQDLRLKEKAYYNLGNCYFRMGIAQKDIEFLKKAAENYQKALEIDPNDQDAKHNLEVVRRHIKLQMEQPPPQACAQPKPQPDQEKSEQKKQEQPQQAQAPQEKEQKQEQKPGQAGQPKELTKEEAERILKALSEQEKEELKKLMEAQAISRPSGKDW